MTHKRTVQLAMMGAALACLVASAATATDGPIVTTRQGKVLGVEDAGINHFLGIPYAAPPIGQNRWRAPAARASWSGVRSVQLRAPACAQRSEPGRVKQEATSEDCLYLNIWAPAKRGDKPLPVMLWLHGGGFQFGNGSDRRFDGRALANKGVVLIAINYRLGVLGFMAHPELTAEAAYKASGNYGMLDQIAALKWVQDNIAAFGGDPANVTLFGQSAGSTAISILQASPLARGLFAKVIGQSTSQLDPAAGLVGRQDMRGAEQLGQGFATKLGAGSLAELRALPAEKLLGTDQFFWPTEKDGYLLPDTVYNIFASGRQSDVPTLVGWTADEGTTLKVPWIQPDATEADAFATLYPTDSLERSATDTVQWQMQTWASLQRQQGKSPVWLYRFDHHMPGREHQRAFHGADVIYTFDNLQQLPAPWTDTDKRIASVMSAYWVNFARTGNPNGADLPTWPKFDSRKLQTPQIMNLSGTSSAILPPKANAQDFMDAYFGKRR